MGVLVKLVINISIIFIVIGILFSITLEEIVNAFISEVLQKPLETMTMIIIGIALCLVYVHEDKNQLINWLNDRGYRLIEIKECGLFDAPLTWKNFWGTVYYVKIQDKSGSIQYAWARTGYRLLGKISLTIDSKVNR